MVVEKFKILLYLLSTSNFLPIMNGKINGVEFIINFIKQSITSCGLFLLLIDR